jgi:hypothetical protein
MNAKTSVLFVYNMSLDFRWWIWRLYPCFYISLNKPIATIFHTVPNPDQKRKKIVNAIIDLSDRIVVLTKKSQEILTNYYNCPFKKLR